MNGEIERGAFDLDEALDELFPPPPPPKPPAGATIFASYLDGVGGVGNELFVSMGPDSYFGPDINEAVRDDLIGDMYAFHSMASGPVDIASGPVGMASGPVDMLSEPGIPYDQK